ncbi:MAG: threonine ammonia-lyase, biosynthetic [Gammaproteobacteria bacterium]|nr:threonine ammonia-lyase, biosynthetic [Gammaproteobacteria bacterium]
MSTDYLKRILRAQVYDVAIETPLDYAKGLSSKIKNQVWIKREDLQPVFSFKIRGAYNKIVQLSDEARQKGIVVASAGNHAQGAALACQRLGIRNTIVMPKTTPAIKIDSVRSYGSEVVLHGNTYDEAYLHARKLEDEHGYTFVHPYDDPDVIAGQGTVAMEILRQHSAELDAVFVPVGGGGLIAGVSAYIKQVRPEIKIIGVEAEDSACLYAALQAGERVILDQVGIFADGVAVRQIGEETFKLAKQYVDEVITVDVDEICAAIKDIFDDTRSIAEPAGALAIAGIKKYVQRERYMDLQFVAIDSGANMNFDRLRYVAERSELGEQREALLAVTIDEQPGSFHRFCHLIGQRNITEFNYRYADAKIAHIFVGIQLREIPEEKIQLMKRLEEHGYQVLDMSRNEMAKLHVRYMVGGHAPGVDNEIIYRFEFPERPGALLLFLTKMGQRWNISMFHYRNHGAAYGRVLAGIQVPNNERNDFQDFLKDLGYPYWDETDNESYRLFLGKP